MEAQTISVRSCVNLPGLRFGASADVDPGDPYIAGLLNAKFLVALDASDPEAEAAPPPPSIEEQDPVGESDDAGAD